MAKNKGGTIGFVAILIALIMVILAIVGVCITWVNATGQALGGLFDGETGLEFSDLFDTYGKMEGEVGGAFKAMASFAILTVILAAASTVLAGICKVLNWKFFKFILIIVAIVCVICGVVSIITSYTFCNKISVGIGSLASATYAPAAGAWLTAIGGILAGLVGVFAAVKN